MNWIKNPAHIVLVLSIIVGLITSAIQRNIVPIHYVAYFSYVVTAISGIITMIQNYQNQAKLKIANAKLLRAGIR